MPHQHGLFVLMWEKTMCTEEIKRVHKTNRDWQHDVSESSETMSDDEECCKALG
jgi:hypothetical protein